MHCITKFCYSQVEKTIGSRMDHFFNFSPDRDRGSFLNQAGIRKR